MSSVKRTRGIGKVIRKFVLGQPAQKYVTAGDRACCTMVQEARSRRPSGPSDRAILAWADYDLARELRTGFWEFQAA